MKPVSKAEAVRRLVSHKTWMFNPFRREIDDLDCKLCNSSCDNADEETKSHWLARTCVETSQYRLKFSNDSILDIKNKKYSAFADDSDQLIMFRESYDYCGETFIRWLVYKIAE